MKQITVSGAIILRTQEVSILRQGSGTTGSTSVLQKQLFATQRGYGDWKGWWEIPGGKIEQNEMPEECIVREIREELATEVRAEKEIGVVEYDYPTFHLTMHCILCSIVSGKLELLEHENATWLTAETLRTVKWLPADELILDKIEKLLQN